MKRITTGKLAKAIQKYRPIVTDDMVRGWAEKRLIPADRNPGSSHGWWYVLPDAQQLRHCLLTHIQLSAAEVDGIFARLGLDARQGNLF